jgi:hypothetical protein
MLRTPAKAPVAATAAPAIPPRVRLAVAALCAAAATTTAALLVVAPSAEARIPLDSSPLFSAPQESLRRQQREDLVRLFEGSPLQQQQQALSRRASADRQQPQQPQGPPLQRAAPSMMSTAARAKDALAALTAASAAVDAGDYDLAAREYSRVVDQYGDLALSEYARFGAALVQYQKNDAPRAIAGLEDVALALRGRAEAHAALAAVLYAERPAQLSRAELEFEVASEFDSRYGDIEWVARERHWPPRAVEALRRFLALA